MDTNLSHEVNQVYQIIGSVLGETFSFKALVNFTSLHRNKVLVVEQDKMPVALSGYCLALQDVDLVCTRSGMDNILMRAVQLHEISHILLGHMPLLSNGPETPSYKNFLRNRDRHSALYRSGATAYDTPQEYAAEMLATLLLPCIMRDENSIPRLAEELLG